METATSLFAGLITTAALGGAAFALFVVLVLARRFDVAERRHRYEIDQLVRAVRRLEENHLQINRNLCTIAGAGQRLAAEIEKTGANRRQEQTRKQQDEEAPASPPQTPRIIH